MHDVSISKVPPMNAAQRLLPLTTLLVLFSGTSAHAGSVTVGGVSEAIATNRALAMVPSGKTVTDTTCEEIGTAGNSSTYRCTVTWE